MCRNNSVRDYYSSLPICRLPTYQLRELGFLGLLLWQCLNVNGRLGFDLGHDLKLLWKRSRKEKNCGMQSSRKDEDKLRIQSSMSYRICNLFTNSSSPFRPSSLTLLEQAMFSILYTSWKNGISNLNRCLIGSIVIILSWRPRWCSWAVFWYAPSKVAAMDWSILLPLLLRIAWIITPTTNIVLCKYSVNLYNISSLHCGLTYWNR